jgi:hypothetical protein
MRRKLKNFKNKNGHSENGAPRTLIDLAVYREHRNNINTHINNFTLSPHWDPQYSGWSNATRPRDHNIFLRSVTPIIPD